MKLVYDFLFIAGMLFASVYIYILYKSKDRGLHKSILIAFFGALIFVILESYASIHKVTTLLRVSILPTQGIKLALAPLLLFYIQSLFLDDKKVLKRMMIHLVPFALFMIFVSLPYLIGVVTESYFVDYKNIIEEYLSLKRVLLDIIFLVYIFISFKTFYKFKKALKCSYSYIQQNNFIWVRYLLIASLVVVSADFFFASYNMFFERLGWRTQNTIMLFTSVSIFYGAYYGIKQSKVLVPYFLLENNTIINSNKGVITKQQESEFSLQEELLIRYMEKEKPYLDEELTLSKLANGIGITDKKLSALLNQHIETSFYNFVNSYRIKEFKELITSPIYKEYTIEGIAYHCGFKSKASFYRIFKKETGQSPSEFKAGLK
ncbi:AraC family transcriptional regulator [Aquimarina gracilis]|uniref:AraC family transcriptional regulator n=1 Tax=Aquimarina gracilis TaxID=874422 RepID=A0ABU5ZX47_9FLAO|nr:AraC family transcriptional regulator [Aquimarina gracilis]MEB3346442.1 AraC family transcriptional regulator [Aquimarina gracilis]